MMAAPDERTLTRLALALYFVALFSALISVRPLAVENMVVALAGIALMARDRVRKI